MQRIACINLPEFPLQLLFRRHIEWAHFPTVVVDRDTSQGVVLWANDHARRLRILPGMRYASGLSLSSELRAGVVGEGEVRDALDEVTRRLCFFSAAVEASEHESGVFWLDASGLSLLYPSLYKWAGMIRDDVGAAGFRASVVVASTRFGSYAVAKSRLGGADHRVFDSPEAERVAAAAVPIDRLGVDPALRDTLLKLGITTVGGFLQLPSNGVKKRFGADVHRLYTLARGELFAPLQPHPPREPIATSVHLDYPETNLGRLIALIDKELRSLFIKLSEGNEVLSAVALSLRFDDGTRTTERLQPANPTLEIEQVLELVRLRLAGILEGVGRGVAADPGRGRQFRPHRDGIERGDRRGRSDTLLGAHAHTGVTDADIEVVGTPAVQSQGELFVERTPRDLSAVARAVARLRAELGERAVVKAVLREGHLPEARFAWEPVRALDTPRARDVRHPPLVRRFYDRPVVFSPDTHRRAGSQLGAHIDNGTIREALGPYVVAGGWWNREVHREYYFVRTADGRSLWMYYDRSRRCWYIHGEVE